MNKSSKDQKILETFETFKTFDKTSSSFHDREMNLPTQSINKGTMLATDRTHQLYLGSQQKHVVVSVVGHHAGESEKEIFARKIKEIQRTGLTFWLYKSYNAPPPLIQQVCRKALEEKITPVCFFIEPSSKNGAQATKKADKATEFSKDGKSWGKIPSGVLVTGSVKNSFAMVIDNLQIPKQNITLNLWEYSKFGSPGSAVQIKRGGSTVCCVRESSIDDSGKLVSNIRRVLAIGMLASPFGVWLK